MAGVEPGLDAAPGGGAQSLALGLIALSLTFLGGYGGMVSLAQMTVAGVAGYLVAILGSSHNAAISLGWAWWVAVPLAIAGATVFATVVEAALPRLADLTPPGIVHRFT